MQIADLKQRLDQALAEVKTLKAKLEVRQQTKSEQIAQITIEDLKSELQRMDNRHDELNKKYQKAIQK